MQKIISNWRHRRKYRKQQSRIQHCHLYVVGEFGLALPVISTVVTFPEDTVLSTFLANMLHEDSIGASVIAALDLAERASPPSSSVDYKAAQADFLDNMERYRKSLGLAKRRFEQDIGLLGITREAGEIRLTKNTQAHGRFAFEETKLPSGQLVVSDTRAAGQLGRSILSLLENVV